MSSQTTNRISKKSEKVTANIASPTPASIAMSSPNQDLNDKVFIADEDEADEEDEVTQLDGEQKLDGEVDVEVGANDSDVDDVAESDADEPDNIAEDDDDDDADEDDDAFDLDEDGEAPVAKTVGKKSSTNRRTKTQISTPDDILGLLNMQDNDTDEENEHSSDEDDVQMNGVMEADEDDDDEDTDMYLQKFDEEVNTNYLMAEHPNEFNKNYDEIDTLCNIVRDENNNIIDPLHRTIPYLSKYERTRVLGQRAKQINSGSKPFVVVPDNIIDGYIIAEMELLQKRIPFIIQRPLHGGVTEYWKLRDLEIL